MFLSYVESTILISCGKGQPELRESPDMIHMEPDFLTWILMRCLCRLYRRALSERPEEKELAPLYISVILSRAICAAVLFPYLQAKRSCRNGKETGIHWNHH